MNKTVLITGASSGIGLSFAQLFAKEGSDLVMIARDRKKLEKEADEIRNKYKTTVVTLAIDLSEQDSAEKVFKFTQKENLHIDALINNAGFATYGLFHTLELKRQEQLLRLNIEAVTSLCHIYSQEMVKKGQGSILNIASIAAFLPGPLMATYYASKAYVMSFSVSLSNELKPYGVAVSCLCPGPTATGFVERAGLSESKLFKRPLMTSDEVARAGYEGLQKRKTLIIPGFENKLTASLGRHIPVEFGAKIARYIQEKE